MCIEIRTHWIWYFVGQPYILSNQITRKMFIKGGDRTNFKSQVPQACDPLSCSYFRDVQLWQMKKHPSPFYSINITDTSMFGIFFLLVNFCLLIHHCKYVYFYKQWIKYIILFCPWTANNSGGGVESGRGVLKGMNFLKLI